MTTSNSSSPSGEPAQIFQAGQRLFNRYKLDRLLGQGGMGVVWLARDEELDREVAVKFLPAIVVNDRASLNDLKRETKRSLELTHPNIVRTYDFVQDSTIAGITMEYVECDTLRNRKSDRPSEVFEPAELADWVRQLCDALDYAHQNAAIVHRDLKPANLLINARNQMKVADFGISRSLVESVTQVTGQSGSSGTLVYMSPQQLSGDRAHPLDDIYAIGATLYELCTRKPPFYSGDLSGQIHGKVPPSMKERRLAFGVPPGEIPENWEMAVAACLAKDPAQRPRTAGELAVRLGLKDASTLSSRNTVFAGPPTAGEVVRIGKPGFSQGMPPPLPGSGAARGRRSPALLLAGIAAALVVIACGAAWMVGEDSGSEPKRPGNAAKSGSQTGRPASSQKAALVSDAVLPASARGGLLVDTEPTGARVKVDDLPAEKTPVPIRDLAPGLHSLTVMLDGYQDFTTQIEVKENQTIDTGKIKLVRSTGWLNVTTNPPGAEIAVRGPENPETPLRYLTPWNSEKLPAGDYEISVTPPGWQPIVRTVTLARDQSQAVALDLSGGAVEITSVPPKAKVLLGGVEVGTTPYSARNVQPGGKHYTLSFAGYQDLPIDVAVEAGGSLNLQKKLVKNVTVAKAAPARPAPTAAAHSQSQSSRSRSDEEDRGNSSGAWDKAGKAINMFRAIRGY